MTSCFRTKVLAVLLTVISVLATNPTPVFAQDPVLCETNVGVPGQLLDGYLGVVYAPVVFDQVQVLGGRVDVVANLQGGRGVFVGAGEMIHVEQVDNATPTSNQAEIAFQQNDGTVVYQCQIDIVAYNPTVHDLAALQVGDCSSTVLAGLPQLVAGHAQVWAFPEEFATISISLPRIADASQMSTSTIYLLGKSEGIVILGRSTKQVDGTIEVNLCPVTVVSQQQAFSDAGPADDVICHDVDGVSMRLTVGQTAHFAKSFGVGTNQSYFEYAISARDILDPMGSNDQKNAWIIKAIAPGTSSLTAIDAFGQQAKSCVVVVE